MRVAGELSGGGRDHPQLQVPGEGHHRHTRLPGHPTGNLLHQDLLSSFFLLKQSCFAFICDADQDPNDKVFLNVYFLSLNLRYVCKIRHICEVRMVPT